MPLSGNENDVLCLGRIVKGVGNERMISLALLCEMAYATGNLADRRDIVNGIIDEIHRLGGRFLRPDTEFASTTTESVLPVLDGQHQLVELSIKEQRKKVVQLFRNLRRRHTTRPSVKSTISPSVLAESSNAMLPPLALSGRLVASEVPVQPPMIVNTPRPEDVLFGQQTEHPGNQLLRELVGSLAEEYNRKGHGEKMNISLQLSNRVVGDF